MKYTLYLPADYRPVPLPGLTAWLAALRSGEHQQGRDTLGTPTGPKCCLGVLSYIQGRLTPGGNDGIEGNCVLLHDTNPACPAIRDGSSLPKNVRVYLLNDPTAHISSLNDRGMPFSDIADILEKVYTDAP